MKQPRVNDFDPRAQEKPLKSPMDNFPSIQSHPYKIPTEATRTTVPPVPLVPPTKRRKIKQRHPFDIYEDQYETLQKLSLEQRKRGGTGSMSAMVREALDDFFVKNQS